MARKQKIFTGDLDMLEPVINRRNLSSLLLHNATLDELNIIDSDKFHIVGEKQIKRMKDILIYELESMLGLSAKLDIETKEKIEYLKTTFKNI